MNDGKLAPARINGWVNASWVNAGLTGGSTQGDRRLGPRVQRSPYRGTMNHDCLED